jgi:hypothetical protein
VDIEAGKGGTLHQVLEIVDKSSGREEGEEGKVRLSRLDARRSQSVEDTFQRLPRTHGDPGTNE